MKEILAEGQKDSQCRNLFFVTKKLQEILQYNESTVKFINSGVRIFSRTEAKCHDANYRVTQDGVNTMRSFIRKQTITINEVKDLTILLTLEKPDITDISDDLLDIVFKETVPGPMIINYKPIETSEIQCKFSVIAWRGPKSLRLYINKHDRIHFLHMLGGTLPEWLQMQSNTRRERMLVANEKDKKDNEGKSDDRQPEKETVTTAE